MVMAITFSMSAKADLYLDGFMSETDMFNYQSDVDSGFDVNGLFELNGSFYDTFVDTSINLNNNVLFETYKTTTLLTDTGASSIYQTGVAQTVENVFQAIVSNGNRDFGFNAKIIGGTIYGTNSTALFTEQANGSYISNERVNYGGQATEYSYDDVMFRIGGKITNMVESTDKFTMGRMVVPTEWNGITTDDILALNKDKLANYTVQAGEGLWAVVNNSGTDLTYDEILDLNPQVKERGLWAGDVLNLGLTFEEGSLVNIKDWTERDLENKSSKTDVIDSDTYTAAVYADAPDSLTSKQLGHKVQQGEGVWSAANALGVSYDELFAANAGVEGRHLRTGEVLFSGTVTFVDAVKTKTTQSSIGGKSLEFFPVIDIELGMGETLPNVPGVDLERLQSILNTIIM